MAFLSSYFTVDMITLRRYTDCPMRPHISNYVRGVLWPIGCDRHTTFTFLHSETIRRRSNWSNSKWIDSFKRAAVPVTNFWRNLFCSFVMRCAFPAAWLAIDFHSSLASHRFTRLMSCEMCLLQFVLLFVACCSLAITDQTTRRRTRVQRQTPQ